MNFTRCLLVLRLSGEKVLPEFVGDALYRVRRGLSSHLAGRDKARPYEVSIPLANRVVSEAGRAFADLVAWHLSARPTHYRASYAQAGRKERADESR